MQTAEGRVCMQCGREVHGEGRGMTGRSKGSHACIKYTPLITNANTCFKNVASFPLVG